MKQPFRPSLILALIALLCPDAIAQSLLTFQFATTMDTTPYGGTPDTPLRVIYTFDPALPDGSGPGGWGTYGPLTIMQIQLGNQIVWGSGGGISVFNNSVTGSDSCEVLADTVVGQLFGRELSHFRFVLVDQEQAMFNDTSLPLSPGFAALADFQQTEFWFANGGYLSTVEFELTPVEQRRQFTLTAVPEPSSVILLLASGCVAIGVHLKRMRHRNRLDDTVDGCGTGIGQISQPSMARPTVRLFLAIAFIALSGTMHASLSVKVSEPQLTGSKAVIKLELKNTFTEKIESARAACFLLDDKGEMVGQSTQWVIGGSKEQPALTAGATNTFHFVITADKLLTSTNVTAKVMVHRLILEGGKQADVTKEVIVESKK